ncbi:hypothetical protein ACP70R_019183 [Stipagrostis hirtigluma subsp. patula]
MEEDDIMELELLWAEPINEENHLDECLGGLFDRYTYQMEDETYSLTRDAGMEVEETFTGHGIEDYIEPSMLGSFSPWGSLAHGPRGTRMKSQSWKDEVIHLFGSQEPCRSGGRKNNDHWTQEEVTKLVDGVSAYGVGKWRWVWKAHFSTSIRTAMHLKDKWRNLVKACKKVVPAGYISRFEQGTMFLDFEQSLAERIREIDAKDPYPRRNYTSGPSSKKNYYTSGQQSCSGSS